MNKKDVEKYLIGLITKKFNISKRMAKVWLYNSLTYNCVVEEILGQIEFLIEQNCIPTEII